MSQDILDNLSVPERASSWVRIIDEDQGRVFVSEHDGSISGFVHAREYRYDDIAAPLPGEITSIYLSPKVMRQGVGSMLLNRGITHLELEGLSQIVLWVLEANSAAIKFYQRFEFYPDGASKTHKTSGLVELRYVRRSKADN